LSNEEPLPFIFTQETSRPFLCLFRETSAARSTSRGKKSSLTKCDVPQEPRSQREKSSRARKSLSTVRCRVRRPETKMGPHLTFNICFPLRSGRRSRIAVYRKEDVDLRTRRCLVARRSAFV